VEVQWVGGHRTHLSLIRPVGRLQQLSYYPELLQRTIALRATGDNATTIARRLTEEGWRPIQGSGVWTYAKVMRLLDQPEAAALKSPRKPLSDGIPRQAHEWTTLELAEHLDMGRDSLHNWVQKGALRQRKVRYRGREMWLIWADEAELERLREMRDFPHYGPYLPRIEGEPDTSTDTIGEKHE